MPATLRIGSTLVGDSNGCYVIAEVGHNHQGSVDKAKEMFRVAKRVRRRCRSQIANLRGVKTAPTAEFRWVRNVYRLLRQTCTLT